MTDVLYGQLFGPDVPDLGLSVEAHWQAERLRFTLSEGPLLSEALTVRLTGFNEQKISFCWFSSKGDFVFIVNADVAENALLADIPESVRRSICTARNQRKRLDRRNRSFLWGVVSVVVLLASGFAWAIHRASPLSAVVAERIPLEQEQRLGELILAQTRSQMKILGQGPAITAIESIGARLTRESRYHYRWYAAQSSELNAFALPGGIVVVTTGLIKATNLPEELAGVIAHEVAHAEKRHGLQSLVKSMGLSVAFRIILGQFDPNSRAVAQHFTELKFSRDAEREADREGLRLLLRARIAPEGMVRIFEKLEQQSVLTTNVPPTFLSSHPALPERLEWLRAELRKPHEPSIPLNMDYAALRAATN